LRVLKRGRALLETQQRGAASAGVVAAACDRTPVEEARMACAQHVLSTVFACPVLHAAPGETVSSFCAGAP
jgi:hypothetical protein